MTLLFCLFLRLYSYKNKIKSADIKSIAKQKALDRNLNYKRMVSFYCELWCRQWLQLHDDAFFLIKKEKEQHCLKLYFTWCSGNSNTLNCSTWSCVRAPQCITVYLELFVALSPNSLAFSVCLTC